jgi:hypothetical protein
VASSASYTHLAATETSGDDRDLQAAAAATLVAGEGSEEREERVSAAEWTGSV